MVSIHIHPSPPLNQPLPYLSSSGRYMEDFFIGGYNITGEENKY